MKQVFLISFLCILSLTGYGQNLVPNGSFENYATCPITLGQIVNATGWRNYAGSIDYFNSCNTNGIAGVPLNNSGSQNAAHGNAYMGLLDYYANNAREYVATTIFPMQIGYRYEVSLSVSLADSFVYGSNGLGVYFYDDGPSNVNQPSNSILNVTPMVSYAGYGAITNKSGWTRLTGTFVTDSAYDNMVIGGFVSNANIIIASTGTGSISPQSYYYIDSVVVKFAGNIFINYSDSLLCAGDTILVPYTITSSTYFTSSNIFTLQLSDTSGSFNNPVNIGFLASNTSGTIQGVIPASIVPGIAYRVRIKSSNIVDSSLNNGRNIDIGITKPNKPVAGNNGPLCSGNTLNLIANTSTSGVTYSWIGPNGFLSSLQNSSISTAQTISSGQYIVAVSIKGCKSKDTTNVVVNQTPAPVIANSNSPVCAGTNLNLSSTASTSGVTYSWIGPNSFLSSSQNPSITNTLTTASGDYIVTASLANCSVKDTVTALVKPLPANINATNNSPICAGSTLNISSTTSSTGVTYSWAGPNSFSSTSQNPSITNAQANASGDYIVTFTLNGCNAKDTTTATVNPIPAKPSANHNSPICAGETLLLTVSTIAGAAYNWTGPGFSSSVQNPSVANIQAFGAGAYIVSATVNGCTSAADTTIVTINPAPQVSIYPSPKDTICLGNNVTFVATGSGGGTSPQYQWAKNNVNVASGITYASTGIANNDVITCKLTNNTTCFSPQTDTSNAITMTVLPWLAPSVSISSNPATPLSPWQMVNFTATATNAGIKPNYQWKRNGQDIVGATSSVWGTQQLNDHDTICCVVTSSYMCAQPLSAISNCIEVQVLTGINDADKEKVHVYPNPVNTELIIEGAELNTTIQLFDLYGRMVYRGVINNTKQSINTSSLVTGTYVLQLTSSVGERTMYKVVKE